MKKQTKGNEIIIDYGKAGKHTFIAGGRKRRLIDEDYSTCTVAVNGLVRFADGTEAYAILEIDESSSGEHWGTGIFLPDGGFSWQFDDDFVQRLGKRKEEVFPYTYKYTGPVRANDHHIGADGWSL